MRGINMVMLAGNVGRDVEVRQTQNGTRVANFTLATSEEWSDRQTGEIKKQTEWHRITAWSAFADIAEKYVRKGMGVVVIGKIKYRKYTDNEGKERTTTDIAVEGPAAKIVFAEEPPNPANQIIPPPARKPPAVPARGQSSRDDDDIPF